ncbi:MAG: YncE family protein [Acidobacteria bacterium]|nr:YncE family protein [Acidobacteriota bacterium]
MKNTNCRLGLALLSLVVAAAAVCGQKPEAAKSAGGYHLLGEIKIGGEGGWDYVFADSADHRLYVSHATKVVVVDTEKDRIVGEIAGTNGVHGIAVAHDFGRGYISAGRDNAVVVFDLKTLKTLDTVKVGQNPDAIIYDPASRRVFAFNGASRDATAIDAESGKVAGTLALGGKPEFAAADEKGRVFVNIEDKSEVVEFDSRALAIKNRWPLAPGEEPSGLAFDRKNRRLFIVCGNQKMIVIGADDGKIAAVLATGDGTDAAAYDPDAGLAFASNGDGTLTIVRAEAADKFVVVENVKTRRGARTMALDAKTHRLYLPTAEFGPPPAPTADRPRPRPTIVPDSFVILVFGK